MPTGTVGSCGRVRGLARGINSDRAVVNVAVQEASPVAAPDVGVQVAAAPKLLDPFLNCTVPVGPAPLLVVEISAVSVTLPPAATLVTFGVTFVVVTAFVIVTLSVADVLAL
jgi:hypothetical protein